MAEVRETGHPTRHRRPTAPEDQSVAPSTLTHERHALTKSTCETDLNGHTRPMLLIGL